MAKRAGSSKLLFDDVERLVRGNVAQRGRPTRRRRACRLLNLTDVPRALANRDTRGGIKVIADADTGKVLGVHALAEGAWEMMLAATYAIKAGSTVDQLADTWAPYLTMAEGIRLAAGLFRNELPTSCCA